MGTGPAGSVFGENSFYRETQGTRRGGLHVAKRSSDPRVAYPEVNVQVRDLVRDCDLNIFYCFNIYMYKQKGRATSSSNISYGPSQNLVRVVGIVAHFAPQSSVFGETSFYRPDGIRTPRPHYHLVP